MPADVSSALRTLNSGPVPKLPPLAHPHYDTHWCGEQVSNETAIFVFADVFEELCYRATHDQGCAAGLLTGAWCLGPFGPYLELDAFCNFDPIQGELALVNYLRAQRERILDAQDGLVLGVALSRSGSGGKLGPDELIALNSFFARPCYCALILDGPADRAAWYHYQERSQWTNVGCYLVDEHAAMV
ncbi:MAG: hypothetical protein RBU37_19210 [Myxococcota bacterium]|jgi:hypothetical protein|nr:hypothetical protein [Myxococcota bacterium]